jgi:phosphoribosylglycinamide formyltransferase-1
LSTIFEVPTRDDRGKVNDFRISILLSGKHGRGSNLTALFEATVSGRIPRAEIVQVIGTHPASPALDRARSLGLHVDVIDPKAADFDDELICCIDTQSPQVICLAGYMRKVPAPVVAKYRHRILNIHPGLLPSFAGKGMYGAYVHQAVIDYGAKITGCTVHLIDEDYDTGPIILQKPVPVLEGDTAESLGARVLIAEHQAYPEALQLIAEGKVTVEGRIVHIKPD